VVFLAQNEEALFVAGYVRSRVNTALTGPAWRGNKFGGGASNNSERPINAVGYDGNIMMFKVCGSLVIS